MIRRKFLLGVTALLGILLIPFKKTFGKKEEGKGKNLSMRKYSAWDSSLRRMMDEDPTWAILSVVGLIPFIDIEKIKDSPLIFYNSNRQDDITGFIYVGRINEAEILDERIKEFKIDINSGDYRSIDPEITRLENEERRKEEEKRHKEAEGGWRARFGLPPK